MKKRQKNCCDSCATGGSCETSCSTEVDRAGNGHITDTGLSKADKRVVRSFIDRKSDSSKKLWTDGTSLDGLWMGGTGIARWKNGRIFTTDVGSRAGQTVQRFLVKETPRNLMMNPANNDLKRKLLT